MDTSFVCSKHNGDPTAIDSSNTHFIEHLLHAEYGSEQEDEIPVLRTPLQGRHRQTNKQDHSENCLCFKGITEGDRMVNADRMVNPSLGMMIRKRPQSLRK